MQQILVSDVIIKDRQRKTIGEKALNDLKTSILSKGLLHPPVLAKEGDGSLRLVAGERRLRAMALLHEDGHPFNHNGQPVSDNHIPYVLLSDLSPADRMEAELEENLLREELTWMERAEAVNALHLLRTSQNPKQTKAQTGIELAEIRGTKPESERKAIQRAQLIVAHKDNPEVKRAKTQEEAVRRIMDNNEVMFKGLLAKTKMSKKESPHKLYHGDCREVLKTLPDSCCSTILADPPYGIDAHQSGQESKHYYDDSPEYSLEICKAIMVEGFRLLESRGRLLMFTDIEHFITLREFAKRQAYSVYRTPLIWYKASGGRTPWGRAGFRRSYEILLFAVKGQAELFEPGGDDVITFKQSHHTERDHAANKPHDLLRYLIRLSTLKGATILDPTCGSGTIIPAADAEGVKTICIEQDEQSYQKALARLTKEDDTNDKTQRLDEASSRPASE